jgi:16S rRNA (guanine527-N7)-methyltransferase
MDKDWQQLLIRAAVDLGIDLEEKKISLFTRYCEEITVWNKKINLISRSSPEDTFLKNCIDSLTAAPFLPHRGSTVLDMGSGGGFPGIPLKIAFDTLKVSLLESSRKKTSFLKHVIRALPLSGITVIHDRAENIQGNEAYRNIFDAVISKAAFKLPQFLTLGASFLAPRGVLIAMKGLEISEEIKEAAASAVASGLYVSSSHTVTLPVTGEEHKIVIYKKT